MNDREFYEKYGELPGDKHEDEFTMLSHHQLIMLARHNQKQITALQAEIRADESRKEILDLQPDNETALEALDTIEARLRLMRDLAKWAGESGSFLSMGTLPHNTRMVIEAMQKDLLKYTGGIISKLTINEIPF